MAGQQTYFLLRLDVEVLFLLDLYIFNQTRTIMNSSSYYEYRENIHLGVKLTQA